MILMSPNLDNVSRKGHSFLIGTKVIKFMFFFSTAQHSLFPPFVSSLFGLFSWRPWKEKDARHERPTSSVDTSRL